MDKQETFSDRFRQLKGAMTAKEFSEKTGISVQSVTNYSTGRRVPDILIAADIAEACRVNLSWLVGLKDAAREPDRRMESVLSVTHLSEDAAKCLSENPELAEFISALISAGIADEFNSVSGYLRQAAKNVILRETRNERMTHTPGLATQGKIMVRLKADFEPGEDYFLDRAKSKLSSIDNVLAALYQRFKRIDLNARPAKNGQAEGGGTTNDEQ